jgi:hypothetical protein
MAGSRKYDDILMGYSESGPMRNITLMRYAGRCVSCGVRVHVVPSAFDLLQSSDSDPALICEKCYERHSDDLERAMGTG